MGRAKLNMSAWLQNLLVLAIVIVCVGVVGRQAVRTLRGKKSKLGACCAKGCEAQLSQQQSRQTSAQTPAVQFFPADALRKRGG